MTPVWSLFFGKNYRNFRALFLVFIPHLFCAALEGVSFALILMAFSVLEGKPPSHFEWIPLWISHLSGMQLFYFYILSAISLQAMRSLTSFFALYGTSLLALKIQTEAQRAVYAQIFRLSYPFISKYKMGDLSEYIKNPSNFIPPFFDGLNRFLVSFFMIVGLLFVLLWISPLLTVTSAVLFSLFALLQKRFIRKVKHSSMELTEHLYEFSHQTAQSLQGIKPIYAFHRQNYLLQKIDQLLGKIAISSKKVFLYNNSVPTISETVTILLVGAVLILGSIVFTHNGQAVVSSLLTYLALTYRLTTRMHLCMGAISTMSTFYGSIMRLNDILDDRGKEFIPEIEKKVDSWNQSIEFKNVSLCYPGGMRLALKNISFSIQKGTTIAFVGLSGAGKSSILDLILGLQKPTEGTVLIDSEDLSLFSTASWLAKVGVVSQEPFVFNDTIEENIFFGDLGRNQQDFDNACDLAGVFSFIQHLPKALKTEIGERGYKLSGGERQRIALARALLKNPEVLLLDEATSNLDSYSEKQIQQSLEKMRRDKTLIIVAHRLSSVVFADQIIVVEQGEITERGNHEQLIAKKGKYFKLWELQSERGHRGEGFFH